MERWFLIETERLLSREFRAADEHDEVSFRKLGMHRVWATCDVRNYVSYRVLEKLGMRREVLFRKDALHRGEWRDTSLYAILQEEWPAA